jgi:hypothetical protein
LTVVGGTNEEVADVTVKSAVAPVGEAMEEEEGAAGAVGADEERATAEGEED